MTIEQLMDLWSSMVPGFIPPRPQFALWVTRHGADVVKYGIVAMVKKNIKENYSMSADRLLSYASKTMRMEEERRAEKQLSLSRVSPEASA